MGILLLILMGIRLFEKEKLIISAQFDIDSKTIDSALNLMNKTQGDGLFKRDYLETKIKSPDAIVYFAFYENKVIAVGCAELINQFNYYESFEKGISKRLEKKKVGSLCTLGVDKQFQGLGIGSLITRMRLDWLKNQNINSILGISWVSGETFTSKDIFEKFHFKKINKIENFFYESSIQNPFYCPGCRVNPCVCSAILFELSF